MLDCFGELELVPKTLDDRVVSHLVWPNRLRALGLLFSEGSFGAFAALVVIDGGLPLVEVVLAGGEEHNKIKF